MAKKPTESDVEGQALGATASPKPEEKVKVWKERIGWAKRFRKPHEERWRRLGHEYGGRWDRGRTNYDKIAVDYLYSILRTIMPTVYFRNPRYFMADPRTDDSELASLTQELVNQTMRVEKAKREFKRCTLDCLITGHGIIKTGWAPAMRNDPDSGQQVDLGHPFVRRISVFDVFIDPEAKRFEDARWIAQKVIKPLSAIKRAGIYRNLEELKATVSLDRSTRDFDESGYTSYSEHSRIDREGDDVRVVIYEIWDLENNKLLVLSDGSDGWLRNERNPYGHPAFSFLAFNDELDSLYPIPEAKPIERLNLELNLLRTRQSNATQRMLQKYLSLKGALTSAQKSALVTGDTGAVVEVNDLAGLRPLDIPPMSGDNWRFEEAIKNDINQISRQPEYQRGNLPTGRTATEATIVEQSSRVTLSEKVDIIEDFASEVGVKIMKIWRDFGELPQVVRIAGPKGVRWAEIIPKTIPEAFDELEVEAGSTETRDENIQRQIYTQLYTTLAADPNVNRIELIRGFLKAYGIKEVERYLNPAPAMPQPAGPIAPIPGVASTPRPEGTRPTLMVPRSTDAAATGIPQGDVPSIGDILSAQRGAASALGV